MSGIYLIVLLCLQLLCVAISVPHRHVPVVTKIYLLLWKDLKILSSNKIPLIMQMVTPLFFCSILVALRTNSAPIDVKTVTEYAPLQVPHRYYGNM